MSVTKLIIINILLLFIGASIAISDWETVDSGVTVRLREVVFIDDLHGWAAGDSATVIATTDGGETWFKLNTPVSEFVHFNKIQFVDSQTGFIRGSGAKKTNDPDNPRIYEDAFLRTQNGGDTWEIITVETGGDSIHVNGFDFIDKQTGWVVGTTHYVNGDGVIAKTTDGGDTWTQQLYKELPRSRYSFQSVDFIDENNGWAIGGTYYDNFDASAVYYTNNSGSIWEEAYEFSGAQYYLKAAPPKELWIYWYGYNHSTDGGLTWFSRSGVSSGTAIDIEVLGNLKGWILYSEDLNEDRKDVVRYTTDGGRSFNRELYFKLPVECYGIDVVESDNGTLIWAVCKEGLLLRHREIPTGIGKLQNNENNVFVTPNPANLSTTIRYSLRQPSYVRLSVFSLTGQKVTMLIDEFRSAGTHEVQFNGTNLGSGIYIWRFESNHFSDSGKFLLMK